MVPPRFPSRGGRGGGRGARGGPRARRPFKKPRRGPGPQQPVLRANQRDGGELAIQLKQPRSSPQPNVWRGMLDKRSLPSDARAGEVVRVAGPDGQVFGRGFYHPTAPIALRLLTFEPEERIDVAFFQRRLAAAAHLRREVLALEEHTNAYRLAHAESDGLPGLVVDVLGQAIKVEAFSAGMASQAEAIRSALNELFPEHAVAIRGDARSGQIEGYRIDPRPEDPGRGEVSEHGVRFKVDLREGHKTGFFCDQRENRAWLSRLCRGRTVLDCHTYSGGFALHAAVNGEAAKVTGVDLDEKAVALAIENMKLNQVQGARFVQADAFHYLRQLQLGDQAPPEVLILDPPKLAKDREERHEALNAYRDLNRLGLESLAPEGILVSCSCSGSVSEQDLLDVLRGAAARTNSALTLLRVAGAGPDHPVALHVPETRYLKVVFAQVKRLG